MKDARRQRLEQLLALPRFGGEKKALAAAIGKAPAQVSQWANSTRTINEESARAIEEKLRLPARWMDGDDATPAATTTARHQAEQHHNPSTTAITARIAHPPLAQ